MDNENKEELEKKKEGYSKCISITRRAKIRKDKY